SGRPLRRPPSRASPVPIDSQRRGCFSIRLRGYGLGSRMPVGSVNAPPSGPTGAPAAPAPPHRIIGSIAVATPMQYLDKAMNRLRALGLVPDRTEEAPIVALLNRGSDLDEDKVVAIARTLSQASLFNQVVREQISSMQLGERYA